MIAGSSAAVKDEAIWQMHQENAQFLRDQQYWGWKSWDTDRIQRLRLARDAEDLVARWIEAMGYQVNPTTNNSPFDLWVHNPQTEQAIRVEVKVSLYKLNGRGGRYQANVRHHQAELLIFIARNGRDWPFVIPMDDIAPRKNVALWSYNPGEYKGQWAGYLEAWDHLHQAIESAPPQAWQPSLFMLS